MGGGPLDNPREAQGTARGRRFDGLLAYAMRTASLFCIKESSESLMPRIGRSGSLMAFVLGFTTLSMLGVLPIGIGVKVAEAAQPTLPPGGSFWDDDGLLSEGAIESVVAAGLMLGCQSEDHHTFCPEAEVTRLEAAQVFDRALELPRVAGNLYADPHLPDSEVINSVVAAGLFEECAPGVFCPNAPISREELATAFARGFRLPPAQKEFPDLNGSEHSEEIQAVAAARIILACNFATGAFCPEGRVTRKEFASFVLRATDLKPMQVPPSEFHMISRFTTYHLCCQRRVYNVHDLANRIDGIVVNPGETFSALKLIRNRVRSGYCQTATTLFNAIYWAGLEDVQHRPHAVNYSRYPDGLESTLIGWRVDLKFRNNTHRPIEIRSYYTGTSITVAIWGDNDGRSVSGDFSPKNGYRVSVLSQGGPDAKAVISEVVRIAPRKYKTTRSVYTNGVGTTESWTFKYSTGV